jgi:hypothetical protein
MKPATKSANWIPFPDPIKEEEVSIDLGTWTTNKCTGEAIERQASFIGRADTDRLNRVTLPILWLTVMDKTIRRNQICVVGLPRCDFVFSSTPTCFIAYGRL